MKDLAQNIMTALERMYQQQRTRLFGANNIERFIKQQALKNRNLVSRTSIAQLNRHTGKPHEHKREIARRHRQQGVA